VAEVRIQRLGEGCKWQRRASTFRKVQEANSAVRTCLSLQLGELQGDFDRMQGGPKLGPFQKRQDLNRLDGVSLLPGAGRQ
jgi:hypothetical protein